MGYAAHFSDRTLLWIEGEHEERRFRLILCGILVLFLAGGIVVPLMPVSGPEFDRTHELPPRIARLVVREPPPEVQAEPEIEEPPPVEAPPEPEPLPAPEPEPEPVAEPEPQPPTRPEPEPRQQPSQPQSEAREKARRSGLVALSGQLAELRDNEVVDRLAQPRRLIRAAPRRAPVDEGAPPDTGDIAAGSGGIDDETLTDATGDVELAEREVTRVENPETGTESGTGSGDRVEPVRPRVAERPEVRETPRSIEEIQPVFDRNKGTLDVLYRRALRRNPALAGKVVLRLTIAPSGEVTACEIVSSELDAPALERKLVARVRMFDFGAREDAAETTTTYPIDFFPFFPG